MDCLNEYSGLFSLLAVVISIVAIVVSVVIFRKQKNAQMLYYNKQRQDQEHYYRKQKEDQEQSYLKQKKDQLQDLRDEFEAMETNSMFPMSFEERAYYGRKKYLEKKLGR